MKKHVKTRTKTRTSKKPTHAPIARWKFLPAIIITLFATFFAYHPSTMKAPTRDVLAYATNVSIAGLLSATNAERAKNGVHALSGNGALNSAAQAKAEDMVNRNYWSHNTPDGQLPWVFITNAGYQYLAAGENLAYGFLTSNDTVTGWMNSPPHRSNLLSDKFTEVGFGIANSANYVDNGQQTVIVAMYAKPQSAPAPATAPATANPTPTPKPKPVATPTPAPAPAPTPKPTPDPAPEPEPEPAPVPKEEEIIVSTTSDTDTPTTTATTTKVSRIQLVTNGWLSATMITLAVCSAGLLWLIHKGVHLKRYIVAGEHFVVKHIHIDLAVLALIYLGFVMLSSSGFVR